MSVTKVGKIKTSGSVVNYVFRKEKGIDKLPEVIGGNVFGATKKDIKKEFFEHEKLNTKIQNTVTHFSVSFPPNKKISSEDAGDYADELMRELGYDKNPYIVVRHYDKDERENFAYAHIHIVASRINTNGQIVSEWQIAERAIEATKKLDKKYKLESVDYTKCGNGERSERNIKKDEYQMMSRTGKLSVIEEFRDCAEESLTRKINVHKFVADVQKGGFEVLPNIAEPESKMRGFSFSKDGIVFTAKKAGNKFKWTNLAAEVDYDPSRDLEFLKQLKEETESKIDAAKQKQKTKTEQTESTYLIDENKPQNFFAISTEIKANETTVKRNTTEKPTRQSITSGNSNQQSIGNGYGVGSEARNENKFTPADETQMESGASFTSEKVIKEKAHALEESASIESFASVAKTQVDGGKSAPIRSDRTDDQIARSGTKTETSGEQTGGNETRKLEPNFFDESENKNSFSTSKERTENSSSGDFSVAENHWKTELTGGNRAAVSERSTTKFDLIAETTTEISSLGSGLESEHGEGVEFSEYADFGISDRHQFATKRNDLSSARTDNHDAVNDRFDSESSSKSEELDYHRRAIKGAQNEEKKFFFKPSDSPVDNSDDHQLLLFRDEQGSEQRVGTGKNDQQRVEHAARSNTDGKREDETKHRLHDHDAPADISASGQLFQTVRNGADKNARTKSKTTSKLESLTNCRAAEITAQVINIKFFSGSLDSGIVKSWVKTIEQSNANDFLLEILKPKDSLTHQKMFQEMEKQAELIAENLELPKPALKVKRDQHKLAEALTKIESAGFEKATGEKLNQKTFEMLVEMKAEAGMKPASRERGETIQHNIPELAEILKFDTALEAKTFNALLDPQAIEIDRHSIIKTRSEVASHEAAAHETATLIQIAYGGQNSKFTDNFKADLADEIYYATRLTRDVYEDTRQNNWRQIVQGFSPIVSSIAEQNKIEIKPPETDIERNKNLAEFVTNELVTAYEEQNRQMSNYYQQQIKNSLINISTLEVTKPQSTTIAGSMNENLSPPKFSNALEASAYNVTKYDERKKAEKAEELAAKIREKDDKLEEGQMKLEMNEQTLIMR